MSYRHIDNKIKLLINFRNTVHRLIHYRSTFQRLVNYGNATVEKGATAGRAAPAFPVQQHQPGQGERAAPHRLKCRVFSKHQHAVFLNSNVLFFSAATCYFSYQQRAVFLNINGLFFSTRTCCFLNTNVLFFSTSTAVFLNRNVQLLVLKCRVFLKGLFF